jgi:hypothetical protein
VPVLFLDTETFSEVPIKHGTHRYAENAEIILFGYAWDDEPRQVYEGMPGNLEEMFAAADEIVIQNQFFDRTVCAKRGIKIPIEKITCTMVLALSHGYPAGLDQMCEALEVPVDKAKKKDGKKLINLFCKPRPKKQKLRRATKESHPEEWAEFVEYCGFDIEAMRECWKRLPRWNVQPFERKLWLLDQKINDRGVKIDLDLAHAALRAAERAQGVLAEESDDMTGGAVKSTTQRDVLMAYLSGTLGFDIPDLKKGTIKNLIKKGALTSEVKEILENRLQAAATSPAKYKVLINSTSLSDGRLRGTLQFCGAGRTSRWGGRLFQPQNLPRPTLEQMMIDLGILAMKANCEDLIFDNVMELCASACRGAIIAPDGKKLRISDLSNIEGRVSAWVAGEDWKVKAFADLDAGRGVDIYVLAYARAFGVSIETVLANKKTGDGMMRQIGKVMELACIAEGQHVLTNHGLRPIEDVKLTDLVWDGLEFVSHEGVVFRGEKTVGSYDGLEATPDHLVFVEGQEEPTPFEQAAARGSRLAKSRPERPTLRLGAVAVEHAPVHEGLVTTLRGDALHGVWPRAVDKSAESDARAFQRMPTLLPQAQGAEMAGASLFSGAAALQQPKQRTVQFLRRAWDKIRIRFTNSHGRMGSGKYRAAEDQGAGPDQQRQGLCTGQSAMVNEAEQHSKLSNCRIAKTYDIRNAGPRHRFTASGCLVHNCGYGGAAGAFASMALLYGIELSEEEIIKNVKAWRSAHRAIVRYWYDLEWAIRQAFRNPGESFKAGPVTADYVGHTVRLKMPGGSYLCYPHFDEGDDGQCSYMGINQYTRKWERISSYGPKFFENVVQKISRDILARGMIKAEETGFEMVLHVHDELVAESREDDEDLTDARLSKILATVPPWALGLPLAAAGHSTSRYAKE